MQGVVGGDEKGGIVILLYIAHIYISTQVPTWHNVHALGDT